MKSADIVITACGVPGIVRAHWIKPEAVVVDVGINFVENADRRERYMIGDVELTEETL